MWRGMDEIGDGDLKKKDIKEWMEKLVFFY
jgi:hypothetical protein